MDQSYSTDVVPPKLRFSYWRKIIAENFVRSEVECGTTPEDRFYGVLTKKTAKLARLFEIRAAAHAVRGSLKYMKPVGLFIFLQTEGEGQFIQDGNRELLIPGDFIFLDASREMESHYSGPMGNNALLVFLEAAPVELRYLIRLAGQRIDGAQGVGRVASHFLRAFMEQANNLAKPQADRLLRSLIDVLSTTTSELGEKEARSSSRHRAFHLHRIRLFLEDNLRDADLTPAKVAAAHGISRRYLSKLFEDEGVSIVRYIWERRLEHCQRDLADPAKAAMTITEIAFAWGFNSASHFSRAFKERFGMSPRQSRFLWQNPLHVPHLRVLIPDSQAFVPS